MSADTILEIILQHLYIAHDLWEPRNNSLHNILVLISFVVDNSEHKCSECNVSHRYRVANQISCGIRGKLIFKLFQFLWEDFDNEVSEVDVFILEVWILLLHEFRGELLEVRDLINYSVQLV